MRILCPKCGKKGNADNSIVGKRIRCPSCKEIFVAEKVEEDVPTFTPDPTPEPARKDSPNYVLVGSAFVVLIGMFLPWIDLGIVSLNAFSLTQIVKIAATVKSNEISSLFAVTFTFYYLLPVVAGTIIALELLVTKSGKRHAKIVTVLVYLLFLITVQFFFFLGIDGARIQEKIWILIGFGCWITLFAILTAIVSDIVKSGFNISTIAGITLVLACYSILIAFTRSDDPVETIPTMANEKNAVKALKQLRDVEYTFKKEDWDRNSLPDYWTADVSGLYRVLNASGYKIAKIDMLLAVADVAPIAPITNYVGTPLLSTPLAYRGYYFRAMTTNEYGWTYRVNNLWDTSSTPVCNTIQFAFCAYPCEYNKTGKNTFIVSQDGTIWMKDNGNGVPILQWPHSNPKVLGWAVADQSP